MGREWGIGEDPTILDTRFSCGLCWGSIPGGNSEMNEFNPEESFEDLLKQLDTTLQTLGVHAETMTIAGAPEFDDMDDPGHHIGDDDDEDPQQLTAEIVAEQIKKGKGHFIIAVTARTKDMCWTPRILDPEGFQASQTEEIVMPTTADMLQSDIKRQLEDGVKPEDIVISDIFKPYDDPDEAA